MLLLLLSWTRGYWPKAGESHFCCYCCLHWCLRVKGVRLSHPRRHGCYWCWSVIECYWCWSVMICAVTQGGMGVTDVDLLWSVLLPKAAWVLLMLICYDLCCSLSSWDQQLKRTWDFSIASVWSCRPVRYSSLAQYGNCQPLKLSLAQCGNYQQLQLSLAQCCDCQQLQLSLAQCGDCQPLQVSVFGIMWYLSAVTTVCLWHSVVTVSR